MTKDFPSFASWQAKIQELSKPQKDKPKDTHTKTKQNKCPALKREKKNLESSENKTILIGEKQFEWQ